MDLDLPQRLVRIAQHVHDAGGRTFVVGGVVRDHLLGLRVKDLDVEVFGLEGPDLERLLRRHGRVNAVGRAFGVYKLQADGMELDISLPRRDSKVGPGHKGIAVQGDPTMTVREAAGRRDLTVNAMMIDVLTGELLDPTGGRPDLEAGLLRAVDDDVFLEDPLRALRVVQFAARFDFAVDPSLLDLCRRAALEELPAERIQTEWVKLLLRGRVPSTGLRVARQAGMLERVLPELVPSLAAEAALDRAVAVRNGVQPEGRRLAMMLLIELAETPTVDVPAVLDRLGLFRWQGYPLRERLLAAHAQLTQTPDDDAALRHLSTRCELDLLFRAQLALQVLPVAAVQARRERSETLGLLHDPPPPLLQGRHLPALGMKPGPAMGTLLKAVYQQQLDGTVATLDQALESARSLLAAAEP